MTAPPRRALPAALLAACFLTLSFVSFLPAAEAPAGLRAKARLLLAGDKPLEALAMASRAVADAPELAEAWAVLAGALFRNGDFDGAESAARRALGLDAKDPDACVALARCLATRGLDAEARKHLEAAVEAAPEHTVALRLLAGQMDFNNERAAMLARMKRYAELAPPGERLFADHVRQTLKVLEAVGEKPLGVWPPEKELPERVELPLLLDGEGLKVELTIGGAKRWCVFDTGEESVTISRATLEALKLPALAEVPYATATGMERLTAVCLPELAIGEGASAVRIGSVLAYAGAADIVGPGVFGAYLVKMDFDRRRLVLTKLDAGAAPRDELPEAPRGFERVRFRSLGRLVCAPFSVPGAPAAFSERPAWAMLDSGCELPAVLMPRCLDALRSARKDWPQTLTLRDRLAGAAPGEGKWQTMHVLPSFSAGVFGYAAKADGAVCAESVAEINRTLETELDGIAGWPVLRSLFKSIEIDFARNELLLEPRRGR